MKFPEDGSLHARSNTRHFSSLFFSFFVGSREKKRWRAMRKINAYYCSALENFCSDEHRAYTHAYVRIRRLFEYELPLTDYGLRMSTGLGSSPTCISGMIYPDPAETLEIIRKRGAKNPASPATLPLQSLISTRSINIHACLCAFFSFSRDA